jgi:dihydrofolate reductase
LTIDVRNKEAEMRRLTVFNQVTIDGYFTGANGDLSWAKQSQDAEFNAFAEENAKGGGELLFGRITYEMMKSYWPTPQAQKDHPVVAERMNNLPKIVFSKTLDRATWNNTKVVKGDIVAEIRKMKQTSGPDLVLMGSGSIVAQLAPHDVIDEYQLVVFPIVLGEGRTMFEGLDEKLTLKPTRTRAFRNGSVLLCYEPLEAAKPSQRVEKGIPAGR